MEEAPRGSRTADSIDIVGVLRDTLTADFARNERHPYSCLTLVVWRCGQRATAIRGPLGRVTRILCQVLDLLWVQGFIGAELPPTVVCGPGLRLPHAGRGVVVHPNVRIGSGVTLYHQVTLGQRGPQTDSVPTIGDDVYIGAGAKVVGRLRVGNGARIGANAVVLKDVPAGSRATGVPAHTSD